MSSRALAAATLWLVILSLAATAVHHDMVDRANYEKQRELHNKIAAHHADAPYQYRILQPMIVDGFLALLPKDAGPRLQRAAFIAGYSALRFASILTALLATFMALRRIAPDPAALFGVTAVGGLLPFTFRHYYFQPTSVTELAVFACALWIILARRAGLLWPLVLVGTLNRETTVFVPFLYCMCWLPSLTRREWIQLIVTGGCWLVVWFAPRLIWPAESNLWANPRLDRWNFGQVGRNFDTILIHLPLVMVFFTRKREPAYARLAFCAIPWFAIHFAMTHWWEIRYYLPAFLWSLPACLHALEQARPLDAGDAA